MPTKVLIFGATGMLARPVVRRLVADGFSVRAASRNVAHARRVLPAECEFVSADVREPARMDRAMEGCEVAYLNFAQANSPRAFDPDLEGTKIVAERAPKLGAERIMRISTMGIPDGVNAWWVAQRKQVADDAMRASDATHTIFLPTWFMESLPLFLLGRRVMLPAGSDEMLHWLAGDDYAMQVSRAMASEKSANQTYIVQGKYPASFRHAIIRFIAAFDPQLALLPVSKLLLNMMSLANSRAKYLRDLLEYTFAFATGFHAQQAFDDLGEPTMTIEDYARQIRTTGDMPRK